MDWIDLAHDRDRRWAPVNAVINPSNAGNFMASYGPVSSQKRLCPME